MTTRQPGTGEFEIIRRFFAPLAADAPGAFGLTDDAARLEVPPGHSLVVTSDALVAGIHFLATDTAADVAAKALRVNLSDLASMGARPMAYTLALALTRETGVEWLEAFAASLAADQRRFGITLIGGDTVATPGPLTLCICAFGCVASGTELRRSGARPGDAVFVTGTIGDAALGLIALQKGLAGVDAADHQALAQRYRRPTPRTACGPRLVGLAHAAIDVSDGLLADLGHICETSGTAAVIESARVPLSAAARAALAAGAGGWRDILGGGDDYELLFAAPLDAEPALAGIAQALDVPITRIGRVVERTSAADPDRLVGVIDAAGRPMVLESTGYRHF
ncbi:thiamine-phosphate kinase [Shumkonia mesophila]|uniref:thiamine-phosphate kinase n=1 Tax=Shumkonia mesophila TaxID=2838854 RepID=UPI002934E424|nr:thiamine-phosphate kinase [Shumkonia mesophila]